MVASNQTSENPAVVPLVEVNRNHASMHDATACVTQQKSSIFFNGRICGIFPIECLVRKTVRRIPEKAADYSAESFSSDFNAYSSGNKSQSIAPRICIVAKSQAWLFVLIVTH